MVYGAELCRAALHFTTPRYPECHESGLFESMPHPLWSVADNALLKLPDGDAVMFMDDG